MVKSEECTKPLQRPASKAWRRRNAMTGLYAVCSQDAPPPSDNATPVKAIDQLEKLASLGRSLGGPLRCTACRISIHMTEKTLVYRLKTSYRVENSLETRFALIFPVSECAGTVLSLSARINKKAVTAELVRVEGDPSELSSLRLMPALQTSSKDATPSPKREDSGAIYGITPGASDVMEGGVAEVGAEVLVEIRWATKQLTSSEPHALQVVYPFVCAPRLPDEVVCRTVFSSRIAVVRSPNCRGSGQLLNWRARGGRCKVWLTPANAAMTLRREDGVFLLTFYFQDPFGLEHQCGAFGPVCVVVFVGIILWLLLTKDLQS
ncbi:hypothetical protein DQ04_01831040 [Trypanosoma grayi]|uniref:hypothetical protein n=1 Tax=Trypanosoma grayi TaxID=71804 RepID=UPI0004F40406|nr:hypothetical protein DQ04_01831040 [Trypanosoma grayi]KEG12286.1 hypothetical protein DQ04_01831040 [Trypanosoma grayi]